MVDKHDKGEIEIFENDKKLIMELVAEQYFGLQYQRDPTKNTAIQNESVKNIVFDNEEYFYKTGELCKEDRAGIIKQLFHEHSRYSQSSGVSDISAAENLSHEDKMLLLNIIDNIISQNGTQDERFDRPKSISKEDRDSIVNILNSFDKTTVDKDIYDICNLPTRPNSKCNSPERISKSTKKNSIETEFTEEPKTDIQRNKNILCVEFNETISTSFNNISLNIENINVNEDPPKRKKVSSNFDHSDDDKNKTDAKNRFLEFFQRKVIGVDKNQSNDSYNSFSMHISKQISNKISDVQEITIDNNTILRTLNDYDSYRVLDKCIIEEKIFNFSVFKMPMKDIAGPYYINKDEVSVNIYQDGLMDGWNPSQVLYELCAQCQWHLPIFLQHDYSQDEGFHFGVSVKDCHFIPADRGANKKLAKHYASTFFLHFLGFKFRFNTIQQLVPFSTCLYNKYNNEKYRPALFNDALECGNNRKYYKTRKRAYQ